MFGYGFGSMGLGMALMILFWVGLLALVAWLIARLFPRDGRSDRDAAADLLRRRYAAGEISEAELDQALKALG